MVKTNWQGTPSTYALVCYKLYIPAPLEYLLKTDKPGIYIMTDVIEAWVYQLPEAGEVAWYNAFCFLFYYCWAKWAIMLSATLDTEIH